MTTSTERQQWLENSVKLFRTHFEWCGFPIPDNVRVSIGLPKGRHGNQKALGQCWSQELSNDNYFEIFVSPEFGHSGEPSTEVTLCMLETIAHELVHATVGTECGHKGAFKSCAIAVGFTKPFTTTPSTETMKNTFRGIIEKLGEFPAGALNIFSKKKKSIGLIKCECENCGYVARVSEKWINDAGTPICPQDQEAMICY